MKKITIFLMLAFYGSLTQAAVLQSSCKNQLEAAFINKTFTSIGVDNLNGKTVDNSNAIYLDGHGIIYGKMGYKPDDLPQYDQGTYTFNDNGTVSITWNQWDNAKKLCFNIFETTNAYITVDCDNIYHSTVMKSDIKLGNQIKEPTYNPSIKTT